MFGWLKKKVAPAAGGVPAEEQVVLQVPGVVFAWHKGVAMTAVDEVVVALPMTLFEDDRPIGDFLIGPDDLEVTGARDDGTFLVGIQPGMTVSLGKGCQAYLVADDKEPRKIKMQPMPR